MTELEKAKTYKKTEELLRETKYTWAQSTDDMERAIQFYTELGDYKESKSKLEEAKAKKKKEESLEKLKNAIDDCESDGTTLSSDGESIIVNAKNGYDYTSDVDIVTIIAALGLPDSLGEEMASTNALMGRQTETYDDYEVSWSYHPDNGLDAIFKYID